MRRELHVRSIPSPVEHWRHLVEIVALVAAAAWAVYVFVYQERIKPANELPRLQPQLSVHHVLLTAQKEYVEVELSLTNTSGAPASLDGLLINVYGRRFATTSSEQIESALSGIMERNRTLTLSKPTLLYSFYDTWRAFGAQEKVANLEPGRDFRERIAFGVTPRTFDTLKVTYFYCHSRPGSRRWPVRRMEAADGSYYFGGLDLSNAPNLFCGGQRRGEYFPI